MSSTPQRHTICLGSHHIGTRLRARSRLRHGRQHVHITMNIEGLRTLLDVQRIDDRTTNLVSLVRNSERQLVRVKIERRRVGEDDPIKGNAAKE